MKESKLKKHLETLTKEQIIELYLQKCFDTKFEQNKLAIQKLEEIIKFCEENKEEVTDIEVTEHFCYSIGLDKPIYLAEIGLYDFITKLIKELKG